MNQFSQEEIDAHYEKLKKDAAAGGYFLNPDEEFTKDLAEALLTTTARYGYPACPCRLADGDKEEDKDIICPCYYRDADVSEFGACYCALYVSREIANGQGKPEPVLDRRPVERNERPQWKPKPEPSASGAGNLPYPVWRCSVCGYLAARDEPPNVCPVCKVGKDRFERFL